jgi:CubicO group peptidase (beta-lactamase class C family)
MNRFTPHQLLSTVLIALLSICAAAADTGKDQKSAQIDKVFADLQKAGSPGCALEVVRDAKVVYATGYGLASVELNSPITPETVFDIGSTSKQFTASSILLLEQQGKLSVNDDVRKYIPELPDYSNHSGQKITILNLLNHTSGLRDYLALLQLSGVSGDSVTTDDDALALIVRQKKLEFVPGSDWAYSNTGFFLLSVIVKRVSGMTLRDFAAQYIFQPLQMTHTSFRDDHTMLVPHRALAYDPVEKSGFKLDVSYYEQLGDGAVHTSVEDLAKWDENFYSARVGGKDFLAELQERGKLTTGKTLDYAKGLFIKDYRGLPSVRHGGAWGGYRAELMRFPEQHFSIVCLCNLANANPEKRSEKVADIYLGELMKTKEDTAGENVESPATAKLTSEQMAALTGTYRNAAKGNVVRVSAGEGKLQLEFYGSKFGLRPLSPNQFVLTDFPVDATLTFALQPGHARGMKISGDEMIAASYEAVKESAPTADELAAYSGDFTGDELGVLYHLRVVEGKLKLTAISDSLGIPRTGIPVPDVLRPTITDEFEITDQAATFHFLKDAKGVITGFNLNANGTRGIQFSRTQELKTSVTKF